MSTRHLALAVFALVGCADPGGPGVAQSIPDGQDAASTPADGEQPPKDFGAEQGDPGP